MENKTKYDEANVLSEMIPRIRNRISRANAETHKSFTYRQQMDTKNAVLDQYGSIEFGVTSAANFSVIQVQDDIQVASTDLDSANDSNQATDGAIMPEYVPGYLFKRRCKTEILLLLIKTVQLSNMHLPLLMILRHNFCTKLMLIQLLLKRYVNTHIKCYT